MPISARGCGLSPFSDVLSANVPPAARALSAAVGWRLKVRCGEGEHNQLLSEAGLTVGRQGRRDAGDTRGDSSPALLASRPAQPRLPGRRVDSARLQHEPFAKLVMSVNTTSVLLRSKALSKAGKSSGATDSSAREAHPLCTASCHVHCPARLPAAEGRPPNPCQQKAITRAKAIRAGFEARDPRVMGREGRETSQPSPAVSEWEGERKKPGNTWGVATGPRAQPCLGGAEGHGSYPKFGASRGKGSSLA